jgi:hypothetical protein
MHAKFESGSREGNYGFGNLEVTGTIILKWILKEWYMKMWNRFVCLRMDSSSGFF